VSAADWIIAAGKIIGEVFAVGEKVAPALSGSIWSRDLLAGLAIAGKLPWSDIATAIQDRFSNPAQVAVTADEVLQLVAPLVPGLSQIDEAVQVFIVLAKLGVITSESGGIVPSTALPLQPGDPAYHAPFI
jgi:hypothetical protein